ncbi:MAG: hypothetical protein LBT00_05525 [Spirochaetaceae bacterium]|nr:hypothetical protein [Spirochaetaceae bacterium]
MSLFWIASLGNLPPARNDAAGVVIASREAAKQSSRPISGSRSGLHPLSTT